VETSALGPKPATAAELKVQLDAEREGAPFLMYRDEAGEHRLFSLGAESESFWIGRDDSANVSLSWDPKVSSLHAQVERVGGDCMLVDDGLSRNGSFVNGERVQGRRRLRDGDMLRFGATVVLYRAPTRSGGDATVISNETFTVASLSDTQRRVLVALCRPIRDSDGLATPATNHEIAGELFLSVDAVKAHLRTLFAKFDVEDLPQNRKRTALAERALQSGLLPMRDD
jgi:pSer/pThr/pTyr-binding forkhead associated (FHA) protein/DNA-binding CsgD family transcriptional regulator